MLVWSGFSLHVPGVCQDNFNFDKDQKTWQELIHLNQPFAPFCGSCAPTTQLQKILGCMTSSQQPNDDLGWIPSQRCKNVQLVLFKTGRQLVWNNPTIILCISLMPRQWLCCNSSNSTAAQSFGLIGKDKKLGAVQLNLSTTLLTFVFAQLSRCDMGWETVPKQFWSMTSWHSNALTLI